VIDDLSGLPGPAPSLSNVLAVLDRHHLSDLPIGKVSRLLSEVVQLAHHQGATASLTPQQLEALLADIY
jgi:hypothetical protein